MIDSVSVEYLNWAAESQVLIPAVILNRQQPYHPVAQDWLPTEAKQGWAWSVSEWETSCEN